MVSVEEIWIEYKSEWPIWKKYHDVVCPTMLNGYWTVKQIYDGVGGLIEKIRVERWEI